MTRALLLSCLLCLSLACHASQTEAFPDFEGSHILLQLCTASWDDDTVANPYYRVVVARYGAMYQTHFITLNRRGPRGRAIPEATWANRIVSKEFVQDLSRQVQSLQPGKMRSIYQPPESVIRLSGADTW